MNRLSLPRFTLKGIIPPFCHGCRRLAQQPLPNAFLKTLAPRQLQMSTRNVLEPLPNTFTPTARAPANRTIAMPRPPFNSFIPPCKTLYCQCRSTPSFTNFMPIEPFHNIVPISSVILKENFRLKEEAYLTFLPKVNNSITRKAIGRF